MNRLLSTTAALALALAPVQPWPLYAQTLAEDGSVIGPDGAVLCVPTEDAPCDLAAIQADLEATKADAAAQAEADAAAADAAAQAEADAAAADAAAQAEADAAAADAAAQAEAEAAAADAAAQAAAAAAQAAAAAAQAEADAAAADTAAADAAAQAEADTADADAAAQAEAEAVTEVAPAEDVTAPQEAAQADDVVIVDPVVEPAAEATAELEAEPTAEPEAEVAADAAVEEPPVPEVPSELVVAEPAADLMAEPVDVPVVSEEAATSLADILTTPSTTETENTATDAAPDLTVPAAAAAAAAAFIATNGDQASTDPVAEVAPELAPVAVQSEIITEDNTRTSDQEFIAAPVAVAGGKKSGLSDLEKVGLLALGALVVGSIINEGKKDERRVVSNSGDRVVVQNADGTYVVYKDDDAILRRPGVSTRTETYRDGSTRTVVQRANGTEVVTIRDASGRVLRRATYDQTGNEIILIDDLAPEVRIDITTLPKPKPGRVTISTSTGDAALKAEMAALEAESLGRKFSLRQIREIPQVRALAAMIEVDSVTFDSGSAGIKATEARKLADIGRLMEEILAANPAEVFLIEGHTDAVGSAVSNLSLSDRRAESLALALTEYFGIPPENLVIQGYGESELKVESLGDERANRRVVVRLITPLMRVADLR